MLDPRVAPESLGKQPPTRPVLRPGDPNWRGRWLAAVRRRMAADQVQAARMRLNRVQALASDPALWAEVRGAEGAYSRGEGEFFTPGEPDAGDGR